MRVGLGLSLLVDLALRAPSLAQRLSDAGVLPRRVLFDHVVESLSPLALHSLSGELAWQVLLTGIAALGAAMLALGLATPFATAICWLLTLSQQLRDPFSLHGGHHELRLALSWSLFLPLGARWSLDARKRAGPKPSEVRSLFGAALLLQVVMIYAGAALAKHTPVWTTQGTALAWALAGPETLRPLGALLAPRLELLRWLGWAVFVLEHVAPVLMLCPLAADRVRALGVLGLLSLQVGIGLLLALGVFPLVSAALLLGMLPRCIFDGGIPQSEPSSRPSELAPAFLANALVRRVSEIGVAVCLAYAIAVNAEVWSGRQLLPRGFLAAGRWIGLDQSWELYGKLPRSQLRFEIAGRTQSGERVALEHPGTSERWRRSRRALVGDPYFFLYRTHLQLAESDFLRPPLAQFLCREWNAEAPPEHRLVELELLLLRRALRLAAEPGEWRKRSILSWTCAAWAEASGT